MKQQARLLIQPKQKKWLILSLNYKTIRLLTKNMAKPAGQWNRMIVTCRAGRLKVELNGRQVIDLELKKSRAKDRPPTGYVGLQDHGLPLWFRNVTIKDLGGK